MFDFVIDLAVLIILGGALKGAWLIVIDKEKAHRRRTREQSQGK